MKVKSVGIITTTDLSESTWHPRDRQITFLFLDNILHARNTISMIYLGIACIIGCPVLFKVSLWHAVQSEESQQPTCPQIKHILSATVGRRFLFYILHILLLLGSSFFFLRKMLTSHILNLYLISSIF